MIVIAEFGVLPRRARLRPAQAALAGPAAHHRQPRQNGQIARAALVLTLYEQASP